MFIPKLTNVSIKVLNQFNEYLLFYFDKKNIFNICKTGALLITNTFKQ